MAKFIIFLDRLVNFYIYFVVMACFLSLVPHINPNYPMFHAVFKLAGFYLIPPVAGFAFAPVLMLVVLTLISTGLDKIYAKYFAKNQPKVIVLSPEQFIKAMENQNEFIKSLEEGKDEEQK